LLGIGRRWNGGSKVESWCSWPPLMARRWPATKEEEEEEEEAEAADPARLAEPADALRRSAAERLGAARSGERSSDMFCRLPSLLVEASDARMCSSR